MCTAFRDGFQSVYGARVFTSDFLPAVAAAKEAGIDYFEPAAGPASNRSTSTAAKTPLPAMDAFRATVGPDADLQTLARGVNVVGLESQPSDIIKLHAELFKKHGITTIRNFDALNDVDNLIYSGQCIVDAGLKHQVCVTLMELPPGCAGAHDAAFYTKTLRQILDAGIPYDAVCFKDASGTAVPSKVYETISEARVMLPEDTFIPLPHARDSRHWRQCQHGRPRRWCRRHRPVYGPLLPAAPASPTSSSWWHALRGSDYDLDIDIDKIRDAEEVFKECMADYSCRPKPWPWSR